MKKFYLLSLAILIGALVLAACGGGEQAPVENEGVSVPAEYADMKNALVGQSDAADAGKQIFAEKCATCHGEQGKGDGPAGAALNPKPKDLAATSADSDGFLYWRIAEGGLAEPFKSDGSAMPPWKDILSKDEIWQLVTFIRTLQ